MDRSHPKCWDAERGEYEHTCQEPSGRACFEHPCPNPAGTRWGPHWCPEHDVERLDRISRSLESIADSSTW